MDLVRNNVSRVREIVDLPDGCNQIPAHLFRQRTDGKNHLRSGDQGIISPRHGGRPHLIGSPFKVDVEPADTDNAFGNTDQLSFLFQNGALLDVKLEIGVNG